MECAASPPTRLRSWRTAKGYTLEEVSGLTGYSVSMLSRAERGLKEFSPHARVLIARRLGVGVTDLFDVEDIGLAVPA